MTDLSSYPRPNVAVDVAVLTVLPSPAPRERPGSLAVLVQERVEDPIGWALPGRFLRPGESIQECVATALREKAGLEVSGEPRLLRVFDSADRDPRGWTISIAHALALPPSAAAEARGEWLPIDVYGDLDHEPLLFDHDTIVSEAAAVTRARYEVDPDPDGLLGRAFSLADLKQVHEAVLGEMVRRDTFRRRMGARLSPAVGSDGEQLTRVDGGGRRGCGVDMRDGETGRLALKTQLPREARVRTRTRT